MTIEERMEQLPESLKHVGLALVQFVYSLEKGTFEKSNPQGYWTYRPNNFVSFDIVRGPKIVIYITTQYYPQDLNEADTKLLPLVGAGRYPAIEVKVPRQLAAATRYIELSHRRHRPKLKRA